MNLPSGRTKQMFEAWLSEQDVAPYPGMVYSVPFTVFYSYFEDFLESIDIIVFIEFHEHIKQYSGKVKCLNTLKRIDLGVFKLKSNIRGEVIIAATQIINRDYYGQPSQ